MRTRPSLRRLWPELRATLILLHVATLIVLSLPGSYVVDRRRWETKDNQADLAQWSVRLRGMGFELTPKELDERLFSVASAYARARGHVASPFESYAQFAGTHQGWVMFSSPQRHPREIHIDLVDAFGKVRPLYRPRSDEFTWRRAQLDHDRLRKLSSRFGKGVAGAAFDDLSHWVGIHVFAEFPEAKSVRVSLYQYDLLPPADLRAGVVSHGTYETVRELTRGDIE